MTVKVGNRRKYPWEEWFSKPRTVIKRGLDYEISQSMMYLTVMNNARARKVRIKCEDTGIAIVINVIGDVNDEVLHTAKSTVSG